MTRLSRLIDVASVTRLGMGDAALQFVEGEQQAAWRGRRYLALDGRLAFELSLWCGTCPFLFERMEGASRTLSVEAITDRLNTGLEQVDTDTLNAVSALLPVGDYLPILVEASPRLVTPAHPGDYFAEEQVQTWGIDRFWGLPEYPRTPYYRTAARRLDDHSELYEFIVPMVPPTWNRADRVAAAVAALRLSSAPTCLAISVLDICQPATIDNDVAKPGQAHWCWAHFLLDGHHKLQAAASSNRPLRIMSLLTLDASLATREELLTLPSLLS
jgi:hypothetical protein